MRLEMLFEPGRRTVPDARENGSEVEVFRVVIESSFRLFRCVAAGGASARLDRLPFACARALGIANTASSAAPSAAAMARAQARQSLPE